MILTLTGLLSVRASGVRPSRDNENESFQEFPPRRAKERAGLCTDGQWRMAGCPLGSWLLLLVCSGKEVLGITEFT